MAPFLAMGERVLQRNILRNLIVFDRHITGIDQESRLFFLTRESVQPALRFELHICERKVDGEGDADDILAGRVEILVRFLYLSALERRIFLGPFFPPGLSDGFECELPDADLRLS